MFAEGEFDVAMQPLDTFAEGSGDVSLGRFSIEKTYHGALAATSRGEMLSARSPVAGSAGYVAIEQVQGTLDGKKGSFVQQHFGVMQDGANRLVLEVVPDSGSGELRGLSGTMTIEIRDGKHFYGFTYVIEQV
jgi:hypothetical protein